MKENFGLCVPFLYVPKRVDAYLSETLGGRFSRQIIKSALDKDFILINDKPARPSDRVKEGDKITGCVEVLSQPSLAPEAIALNILYEDEDMLVVDKPAGLVVHPGAGHKRGTMVQALMGRGGNLSSVGGAERPGIVHRLDKDTSGLLLVAKNNAAHVSLQQQFASRSIEKTYLALVKGRVEFEQGHIDEPIGRDPLDRKKMAVRRDAQAKEALTRYRVLKRFARTTLLEIRLMTGRTHQIRVHFASMGHPVVGDTVYGSRLATLRQNASVSQRLALHASKIKFLHPKTGKLIECDSPVPGPLQALIQKAQEEK